MRCAAWALLLTATMLIANAEMAKAEDTRLLIIITLLLRTVIIYSSKNLPT
jgi:hypothetical protein